VGSSRFCSGSPQQWAQQQSNEIAGQINHETLGMKNSKAANVSLETAEDEIAHVRLNGIKKWGSNAKTQKLRIPCEGGPLFHEGGHPFQGE
jgi:hypothetical protein